MANEHKFDGVGVCIYCNLCDDDKCCTDTRDECSQWILKSLAEARQNIQQRFIDRRQANA